MELIKELNENLAIMTSELNNTVINFNENCSYFGNDGASVCKKGIEFLTSLLESVDANSLSENEISEQLGALAVLDLLRVKQKYPDKLNESESIRKYLMESYKNDTHQFLSEALGKLVSNHNENGLTLKKYYSSLFENGSLDGVVNEILDDYKRIALKV
jgi:hypothetical protein